MGKSQEYLKAKLLWKAYCLSEGRKVDLCLYTKSEQTDSKSAISLSNVSEQRK